MKFLLRTKDGDLKATLSPYTAGKIINNTSTYGKWGIVKHDSGPVHRYYIGTDVVLDMTIWGSTTHLHIWADDTITLIP